MQTPVACNPSRLHKQCNFSTVHVARVAPLAHTSRSSKNRVGHFGQRVNRRHRLRARVDEDLYGDIDYSELVEKLGYERNPLPENADDDDDEPVEFGTVVTLDEMPAGQQRYRCFAFENVDFLINETEDGLLTLSNTYVLDKETDIYARPETQGDIPTQPDKYCPIEWDDYISGDTLSDKTEGTQVLRVYLIRHILEVDEMDMHSLYCINPETKSLEKCEVVDNSNGSEDPVLRIRPDGVVIEDSGECPTPFEVSEQFLAREAQTERLSLLRGDGDLTKGWEDLPEVEDDYSVDESPDVPEIDLQ